MARNRRQTASIPKRGQFPTSHSTDIAAANLRCAAALISALVHGGVRHVVVSSGSRCAPLVMAAGENPGLRIWTNPDERSAAFLSLGIAKGSKKPAALICTSGTAAANYFPAIIESSMSGVPLVVITADRPPLLRRTGAPQTIDQVNLYGGHVLSFDELPVPGSQPDDQRAWAEIASRTVRQSTANSGPVHINVPFDEPLLVTHERAKAVLVNHGRVSNELRRDATPVRPDDSATDKLREIGRQLGSARRPVIICGPNDMGEDSALVVGMLSDRIGAPILGDVASQLRRNCNIVSHYDLALRDEKVRLALEPDVILRLGALPTSRAVNEWITSTKATAKIGISSGPVADPYHTLTRTVRIDCKTALAVLLDECRDSQHGHADYRDIWKRADESIASTLHRTLHGFELLESSVVTSVCARAGSDSNLFLSNSMPIRWADMYAGSHAGFPAVFVNRGANGIDGIISTAAGIAAATQRVTTCVIGDLTFLHDQNGLWRLVAEKIPLKLILLNNDGGGVFHFLPIASYSDHFERLVAMPHGIDFAKLADAYEIGFARVASLSAFTVAFDACLTHPGPEIIEVRTNRSLNHERHQEVIAEVARAVRQSLGIE